MNAVFDERQITARRRGYTGGFWALLALLGLDAAIGYALGHPLFSNDFMLLAVLVALVGGGMTVYFILSNAYLRPGSRSAGLLALSGLAGVHLLVLGQDIWWKITLHYGEPLLKAGRVTDTWVSYLMRLMIIVMGITALIQWWRNRREAQE